MAAVQPRSNDGGNEKLGAVAAQSVSCAPRFKNERGESLRVGAGVGHGQQTRLVMLQLEVLIGELVAVDGLAAGAL